MGIPSSAKVCILNVNEKNKEYAGYLRNFL